MPEIHARKLEKHIIDTWLGADVQFQGEATVGQNIAILGQFNGRLIAKEDVHIDATANVSAYITSYNSVYIMGHVKGDIDAQQRVEVAKNAHLEGDVITARMVIENGCYFDGHCKMREISE